MVLATVKTLFGGDSGWLASDWTASDDRVRGGQSHSYLSINDGIATFHGHLDIETLGGAGFASQRTTGDDRCWDFSGTDAVELVINTSKSDSKRYAFILKDEILPMNPANMREQATTSWEYEFEVPTGSMDQQNSHLVSVLIPYAQLKPTYRGRELDPGHSLDLTHVRRISIMMRSYFGKQQGDFRLDVASIAITKQSQASEDVRGESGRDSDSESSMKQHNDPTMAEPMSFWKKLFFSCTKL